LTMKNLALQATLETVELTVTNIQQTAEQSEKQINTLLETTSVVIGNMERLDLETKPGNDIGNNLEKLNEKVAQLSEITGEFGFIYEMSTRLAQICNKDKDNDKKQVVHFS
jgi:hypothetical protein